MLGRNNFRTKVMQFLYAQHISNEDTKIVEYNMFHSIEKIFDLYIYLLSLLLGLHEKFRSEKKRFPGDKLAYNKLLIILSKNKKLCQYINDNKQLSWNNYDDYLLILFKELYTLPLYHDYCSTVKSSFEEDQNFILHYYEENFANHDKLYECLEEDYITWVDDLYPANIMVYKTLKFINPSTPNNFHLYNLYRENKYFVHKLFHKTFRYKNEFNTLIRQTSKNWNLERIAILDLIILQMSICEFLHFPSIPPRVTMNEYIEITKMYSTEKSRIFVNGMINKLFKILNDKKK
ncbi:transcription antitermination protein NusB [Candidatus Walczuchella monophlebidarum]|uniref:Transcription antitermination factor NusB n=1 Tax=Candidatus Walczuchella monophlebidarum TaxID=1415657 RepID=A0A068DQE4_9FLAO|nr:transcription antitermination protein NusB [Candidatus Walczuchella monophlebidarum]AID37462.1 transcription antitermination factor NusB [Candidatus Walczuchella monophlebidarum]